MHKPNSTAFDDLRAFLDKVPVIDTHEHYFFGMSAKPPQALSLLTSFSYTADDLCSVGKEASGLMTQIPLTDETQFGAFYDNFDPLYQKTRHTAYFGGALRGLTECWGITDITKESMQALEAQMPERDDAFFQSMLDKYIIKRFIVDSGNLEKMHRIVREGTLTEYASCTRQAFPLAIFHNFFYDGNKNPLYAAELLGRRLPTLDDYFSAFEEMLSAALKTGLICCLKDQSAYWRKIQYDTVPKAEAETAYLRLMDTGHLDFDEAILLSNWFMRAAMPVAEKYNLPVQRHTGHLAGLRGDISGANAVHLTSLINDFPNVHFDLFHGNWPYMGEYLFLAKNYPNVSLDLCWLHSIDCEYSIKLMRRAVMTVPHSKLSVFGGDCSRIELTVGFLCQARDNVAWALSDLVESQWLTLDDAKEIACDWFFNNPNRIFKLGFVPCDWKEV